MALQCQVVLSRATYAGESPAPMCSLFVYNPNAVAVTVISVEPRLRDVNDTGTVNRIPGQAPNFFVGAGQNVTVPALSSLTIGPVPLAFGSAANANSQQTTVLGSSATSYQAPQNNSQPSQKPQMQIMIGANVYGSDGSVNVAGEAGILVSCFVKPAKYSQGGIMQFRDDDNLATAVGAGVI